MAPDGRLSYTEGMSRTTMLTAAAWCGNLAAIYALHPHDVLHCASVLLLYSAVFFLFFMPLHALLAAAALGTLAAGASRLAAAPRWLFAESVAYWALYWGVMLQFVPLHLRV